LPVPFVGVAPLRRHELPPIQAAASEILPVVSYHAGVMMVPHHQGAIDMAQAELRNGHDEQFLRMPRT
jgi:hypothetical protein